MKQALILKEYKSVKEIMDMLLKTDLAPKEPEFDMIIRSMALSDHARQSVKYFDIMIERYDIKPTTIVFASLIKSFRTQTKIKEAEVVWKLMKDTYNIEANEMLYCEMISIYSRGNQTTKATKMFNDYLRKVENNELQANDVTFNAYLGVFSRIGDIKGMKHVIKLSEKYQLIDVISVAELMRGYVVAEKYKKCLKSFKKWLKDDNQPNATMFTLKCVCLCNLICFDDYSFSEKYELYAELQDTINTEMENYGYKSSSVHRAIQLDAAMFLYHNKNPLKIVEIFELFVRKGYLGYMHIENGQIDLHNYRLWTAQFIIRYLFAYKLDELLSLSKDNKLYIIAGKGKHSTGNSKDKGVLTEFVRQELLSWNPPVKSKIDDENKGRLIVTKEMLEPYMNTTMNYARVLLTKPSTNWVQPEDYANYTVAK